MYGTPILCIVNVEQRTHTDVHYNIVFSSFGVGYIIRDGEQQQMREKLS